MGTSPPTGLAASLVRSIFKGMALAIGSRTNISEGVRGKWGRQSKGRIVSHNEMLVGLLTITKSRPKGASDWEVLHHVGLSDHLHGKKYLFTKTKF